MLKRDSTCVKSCGRRAHVSSDYTVTLLEWVFKFWYMLCGKQNRDTTACLQNAVNICVA
jgi:hypothetical protein